MIRKTCCCPVSQESCKTVDYSSKFCGYSGLCYPYKVDCCQKPQILTYELGPINKSLSIICTKPTRIL